MSLKPDMAKRSRARRNLKEMISGVAGGGTRILAIGQYLEPSVLESLARRHPIFAFPNMPPAFGI